MDKLDQIEIDHGGFIEAIYGTKIGENIYRCEESTLFSDTPTYGCEIEVKAVGDKLKFVRIIGESPFQIHRYVWPKEVLESENCKLMLNKLIEIGGFWENAMGGIVILHLPKGKEEQLHILLEMAMP